MVFVLFYLSLHVDYQEHRQAFHENLVENNQQTKGIFTILLVLKNSQKFV